MLVLFFMLPFSALWCLAVGRCWKLSHDMAVGKMCHVICHQFMIFFENQRWLSIQFERNKKHMSYRWLLAAHVSFTTCLAFFSFPICLRGFSTQKFFVEIAMAGGLLTSGLLDCWKKLLQKIPWRIHGIGKIAYIYAIKIQNLGKHTSPMHPSWERMMMYLQI